MSKPKPIQINIPNPCSQSWDGMTLSGQGRFCDHCQKTVIDFTTWTDAALYQYFSKDINHTCGRFLAAQVNRPIHIPHQPHSRLYRMTIAMGLTLLFTQTPDLLAQNRPPKTTQTAANTQPTSSLYELRGRIVDARKKPLLNALIQLYQNGIIKGSALTGNDGNYAINSIEAGVFDIFVVYKGVDSLIERSVAISINSSRGIYDTVIARNYAVQQCSTGTNTFVTRGNERPLVLEEIEKMPTTKVSDLSYTMGAYPSHESNYKKAKREKKQMKRQQRPHE